ncbi:unnamed protein product [Polarella glacialis]|uniref:Uncharacterized protein n=1 Tax=Polarella glacialis TaxID=89957 RepID=A0A813KNH2_POLGL|nr:unnamed protein product [Polarella glacialis]CAE8709377.1 unnamed protein product [Polarella glacialis]
MNINGKSIRRQVRQEVERDPKVMYQALDSVRVTPAQVPKVEASNALFQGSQRRLNDITPLEIQEHIELLENLSMVVVAKDVVVVGLTCLKEALGPVQDKASMQFK